MVRLADVFKKFAIKPAAPLPPVKTITSEEQVKPAVPTPGIPSMAVAEPKPSSSEECQEAYNEALSLINEIMKENTLYELIDYSRIVAVMTGFVDIVQANPGGMVTLSLTQDKNHYITGHSVNVTIISIIVGIELGYSISSLRELAMSAFLHDVGMTGYLALAEAPRKLTDDELKQVQGHTTAAAVILRKISGVPEICITVSKQHHERLDGSGYPEGLHDGSIHEYARIVGVVDLYEAMMHTRKHRPEFPNLEAMQEILKNKNRFEHRLIKIIIDKVGIYPIGSLVQLSTKEIARVVRLNGENNLHPVVKIILNSKGQPVTEEKILDLAAEPAIWIKKGVRE